MSNILKGGWHPGGEKQISRATWKQDLKNIASRKDEGAERAKDHISAPLATLKDPESFGPPPKHSAYYPNAQSSTGTASGASSPVRGLGAPVPSVPARKSTQMEPEEAKAPAGPYRVNTTGINTDNLPKPPGRRDGLETPTSASPAIGRPVPSLPPRKANAAPPPVLPPRQSETPNEYTPPPPPSYVEATQVPKTAAPSTAASNMDAVNRLGQAGVSVPGFGIRAGNASPSTQANSGQINELQQRFARLNNGDSAGHQSPVDVPSWKQAQALHSAVSANPAVAAGVQSAVLNSGNGGQSSTTVPSWKQAQALHSAAPSNPVASAGVKSAFNAASQQKKKPPPPPVKKLGLNSSEASGPPPPIPTLSKPRPG